MWSRKESSMNEILRRRAMTSIFPYPFLLNKSVRYWGKNEELSHGIIDNKGWCVMLYYPDVSFSGTTSITYYAGTVSNGNALLRPINTDGTLGSVRYNGAPNAVTFNLYGSYIGLAISFRMADIESCYVINNKTEEYIFHGKHKDIFENWVKFTFTLEQESSQMQVVDGDTGRVPASAFEKLRMAVDGVEITPVRKLDLSAGRHTVCYYIADNDWLNRAWWYWVGIKGATWTFPADAHNIAKLAMTMRTSVNQEMRFLCATPPWPSGTVFTGSEASRDIYVPSGSESDYAACGFTKIHTL